jgi:hypothetical protein
MKNIISVPAVLLLTLLTPMGWGAAPRESLQENQPEEMTVPEGTVIPIVLTAYLSTRNSQVGDTVYADTTYPIWIQQRLVIPKGSTIRGTITDVQRPGRIRGKGRLAVRFDDILLPNGVKRDFIATFKGIHGPGDENLDRKSETVSAGESKGADAGTVVGISGEGAIIGAIVGQGSGALIGAGAGAAAGVATMLFTRDRNLVLTPGTQFDLELKRPMKFAYNELQFTNAELNSAQRAQPAPRQAAPRTPGRRIAPFGIPIPLY